MVTLWLNKIEGIVEDTCDTISVLLMGGFSFLMGIAAIVFTANLGKFLNS